MNEENNMEDPSPDTTDVRDAIERAKEAIPESDSEQLTTRTPEEHVNIDTVGMPITNNVEMPSAGETEIVQPAEAVQNEQAFQNEQFQSAAVTHEQIAQPVQPAQAAAPPQNVIPADHPMAPLYIQQPMPPTPKANRLAGVLISLLATLGFAVLYAGTIALIRAPYYPPSRFLQDGLLPYITSLGFVLPVASFLVAMIIMVLIFNRAGWWVYAVLGVLVALIVWGAAGVGYSLSPQLIENADLTSPDKRFDISRMLSFAVTLPSFLAALTAREVTTWFGAWIGSRGRKLKQFNAEQAHEYEQKMAEVQARVS